MTKSEIRLQSRALGLPTWDKPAQACLSSRIPYGTPVTVEALARIADAEEYLRSLGIERLRVRHHDTVARIEVGPEDFCILLDDERRRRVIERFREIGYSYVTLDLEGFRSGSLNEVLAGLRQEAGSERHVSGGVIPVSSHAAIVQLIGLSGFPPSRESPWPCKGHIRG